jgi:tetratricopeptide (TPR) repeat protein
MGPEAREGEGEETLYERLARTRQSLERERAGAPELRAALRALPPHARRGRIADDAHFQTWGLAELLLAPGEGPLAADDPEAGRLVLAIADQLARRHPASLLADLRARAWANLGEACLRRDDLAGAGDALREAAGCLAHGTGDLLVDARLLEFEAAVLSREGRPGDALALLKQAAARYRRANETEHLARVLARREELQGEARSPEAVPHFAFEPIG